MAEETNGAAPPEAAAPAPMLQILTQYVRDLSFENIAVQKGVANEGRPDIKVQINIDAQTKPGDRFEVGLKLKVDARLAEAQLYILELDYAGLFLIQNVPAEQLHPLLMIECPRLVFPFLRRVVSDVTRDGGFPPLNLEQIDFLGLYRAELARRQAADGETAQA